MSNDEVKSLNALALAHGGQLTINPQTGLPEAGFLSSILPMVAGVALNAFLPGLGAIGSGLLTGAATGLATGDMKKGLMAGLGAYGGAGLMGGLTGAGNAAIAEGATSAAAQSGAHTAGAAEAAFGNHGFGSAALQSPAVAASSPAASALEGIKGLGSEAGRSSFMGNIGGGKGLMKYGMAAAAPLASMETTAKMPDMPKDTDPGQRYTYSPGRVENFPEADPTGREQRYFAPRFTPVTSAEAKGIYGYAVGGPIEQMSGQNAIGANTGYPMADINKGAYAAPWQTPVSQNIIAGSQDIAVDPYTGQEQRTSPAPQAQFAGGGLSDLGGYSDGGRLLRGPGDGVSDSIPAMIGKKQPARLADGEFVVPARIVSELGNGSTEAGARKLYAMMDRVQKARGKTVGKGKIAKNSRAEQHLPA
jgi:hypothetical protein